MSHVEEGTLKAIQRYREMLIAKGAKSINRVDDDPTDLDHLLWMCDHLTKNIKPNGGGFSTDKFSRWLGYNQGVLACKGIVVVNEERNWTRPWLKFPNGEENVN